jgi:Domain of unknown function (DUF4189)
VGLGRWYWKYNSFWNDADRRRYRARQAEKRRAAASRQRAASQAATRQSIDAWIREHLASTGRDGFTAQEIRDIELQLRTTSMSNAEIAERMRAVRLWRVPVKRSPSPALRQTIGSTFGAIAYSRKTGKWGYSYGAHNQEDAERVALSHCPAPDAKVVMRANGGRIALAAGPRGWGAASGTSRPAVEQRALAMGQKHGPVQIVVSYATPTGP